MSSRSTNTTTTSLSLPPLILAILNSASIPNTPSIPELESLKVALDTHAVELSRRILDLDPVERAKRDRKEKKRKEALVDGSSDRGDVVGKMGSPAGVRIKKERNSLSPAPSNASSASFRPTPGHSQPMTYAGLPKKKKKKIVIDSDDDGGEYVLSSVLTEVSRERSIMGSPPHPHLPSTHTTTSGLKVKLAQQKSRPSLTEISPAPSTSSIPQVGGSIDFSIPSSSSRPLIPSRPGISKPLPPGPKRQADVNEDFSDVKAPSQVQFTTWWNTVEPYIREIREDDLAMLTLKADAPESYEFPARGRHYTEVWEEEDGIPYPRISVPNLRTMVGSHAGGGLSVPHFVPSVEMKDENLVDEQRGLGGLTERIVAALMANGEVIEDGRVADELEGGKDAMRFDVVDLEERIKKELKGLMLLGEHEEYNPSTRDDDEISSALRQCQRLLLQQTTINEQRKARLATIARRRLANTEYQSTLEGVEKSIESAFTKRIKKYGVKKSTNPYNAPRPPVPENVRRLIRVRQDWIDTVGKCMKAQPKGEVMGLPTSSIYEGIGADDEEKDEQSVEDVIDAEMEMDED